MEQNCGFSTNGQFLNVSRLSYSDFVNYLSTKPENAYVCSVLKTLMFLCTQWLWFSEKVVVFCILRGKSCCFFVQFLSKKATLILRIGFQKQKQKYVHRKISNESLKSLEIFEKSEISDFKRLIFEEQS